MGRTEIRRSRLNWDTVHDLPDTDQRFGDGKVTTAPGWPDARAAVAFILGHAFASAVFLNKDPFFGGLSDQPCNAY